MSFFYNKAVDILKEAKQARKEKLKALLDFILILRGLLSCPDIFNELSLFINDEEKMFPVHKEIFSQSSADFVIESQGLLSEVLVITFPSLVAYSEDLSELFFDLYALLSKEDDPEPVISRINVLLDILELEIQNA